MQAAVRRQTLIALLLDAWEQDHAPLGTGAALRVQELVRQLPATSTDEQIRNRLAALLTSTEEEQDRFYQAFERCREQAEELCRPPEEVIIDDPPEVNTAKAGKRRWQRILLGLAAVIVAIGYLVWLRTCSPTPEQVAPRRIPVQVSPGDTLIEPLRRTDDTARLLRAEPLQATIDSIGNAFFVDSTGQAVYIARPESPVNIVDTVLAQLYYHRGIDSVWLYVRLVTPPEPPPPVNDSVLTELPIPFAEDLSPLVIDETIQSRYEWFEQWEWPLKVALFLLLGALLWAFWRWWQYRRAQVIAELRRADQAPYLWNPQAPAEDTNWLQEVAAPLLNRFRGRAPDERQLLDLPKTIQTTSRQAGRIQLEYRRRTLPPDYLLLIDRYSANDHRAQLFNALYQQMLAAEVPVSRYFFNGDPRLCFNDAFPQGISLVELLHRHADARLLIVGEGLSLLSPATGRAAPWTSLLRRWQHRALLNPRPRNSWGPAERELSRLLLMLPASAQGLGLVLDAFLADEMPTQDELLDQATDDLHEPLRFSGDLLADLHRHYSPTMVNWIAACAVWPTLHWDLTLHLGRFLEDEPTGPTGPTPSPSLRGRGDQLVSFDHLRALSRLPWFSQGSMPRRAREVLLDHLAAQGLEQPVRTALRELLNDTPAPPTNSVAYADYRMNIILNELLLRPDPATRRRLEREFANYLAAGKQPDFVALRILDRPASRLDTLVGNRLKKYAFREGRPGLGWQLLPKLVLSWLVLVIPLFCLQPGLEPACTEEPIRYEGLSLCLEDEEDQLLFLRVQAAAAVQAQQYAQVDSLRNVADAIHFLDSAFYLNTATHYYNYGVQAYNCRFPEADCRFELSPDSLAAAACANFRRALALRQALPPASAPFIQALLRACPEETGSNPILPTFYELPGQIIDLATGRPVAAAQIRLAPTDRITEAQLRSGDAPTIITRTTDAQGRFRADSIPVTTASQLQVYVLADGYEPLLQRYTPGEATARFRLRPLGYTGDRRFLRTFLLDAATAEPIQEAAVRLVGASPDPKTDTEGLVRYNYPEEPTTQVPGQVSCLVVADGYPERGYAFQLFADSTRRDTLFLQATAGTTSEGSELISPPSEAIFPQMISIPGGTFTMGDEMGDNEQTDETPHTVSVSTFKLSRTEVTFAEYDAFCEATGREKPDDEGWGRDQRPVINISWYDAVAYCNWLSEQEGYTPVYTIESENVQANWSANGYRLPTEAEWEYAARQGGEKVRFGNGKDIADPAEINFDASANYKEAYSIVGEYRRQTVPVGSLNSPNKLGLHDMSGNVWEWCSDWFGDYQAESQTDPRGPNEGSLRVLRGGSWGDDPQFCRAAYRDLVRPTFRLNSLGFRLARS